MGALIVFQVALLALGLAGIRWGDDTRISQDLRDHYWWPDG